MCFSDLPANCPGKYTLMDEVHPPEGHALRDALGYTLMDEVRPPEGHALRDALRYTLLYSYIENQ